MRIVALGNPDRGDDGAAMSLAKRMQGEVPVFLAGRAGVNLLDLLPPHDPCILLDVVVSGAPPGTLHRFPLEVLPSAALAGSPPAAHGFGAGEALSLLRCLGRSLPPGIFLGIEGGSFGMGEGLSPLLEERLQALEGALREAVAALGRFTPPSA